MIFGLGIGLAVFLLLLPYCLLPLGEKPTDIYARIDSEQNHRFQAAFQSRKRSFSLPGLRRLMVNRQLAGQLAGIVGLDQEKLSRSLARLRWPVSIEEILYVRLIGAACLLASLLMIAGPGFGGSVSGEIQLVSLIPALLLFFLPTWIIDHYDKRAQQEIREQIPVFFGIVQALVEAGMPIHSAIRATARRSTGRLGREFALLEVQEKRFGNWRKALEEMAYLWDVDSLMAVISDINDALTKGSGISSLLTHHIEEQLRFQEDEATTFANRLNIRLLPFLIVFMGIPLLFLVMGPSFIGIRQHL
ncbi:type II secretion system F family protein [Brevibacillus sp. B_LB10_24]|uniref:type II secretion system F family protein n=1 Tax=Brevibacillus sp. B_LB10_24 TaxID=3380645 RepID=UPI0038BA0211